MNQALDIFAVWLAFCGMVSEEDLEQVHIWTRWVWRGATAWTPTGIYLCLVNITQGTAGMKGNFLMQR